MKYPDDFNTPAFPAGKFVAVSRFMAIVVMVIFLLIIFMCGMILWTKKTQDVSPFLISINSGGERWTMVEHDNHKTNVPAYYILQKSLLDKFARHWFTISDNILENQAIWASDGCSRDSEYCLNDSNDDVETCAIYCESSDSVFRDFQKIVLPVYSELESNDAAIWTVSKVEVMPVNSENSITDKGGVWKLNVFVQTGIENIRFMGYANVRYDNKQYPKTMGYYVAEFNMYRMN